MSAADRDLLEPVVAPIVESQKFDLEDIKVSQAGRRRLVRIIVDADGGVDLDQCAEVSRRVSRAFDDTNVMGDNPYTLEVSSPGVSRPLTLPRHWRRAMGRLVRLTDIDGGTVEGRVSKAGDESVVLDVSGQSREINFADIRKARVQVEFRAPNDDADNDIDGETG